MPDTIIDHVEAQSPAVNAASQEGNAPLPSFNVFRFRKQNEDNPDFYDPVTDILNILPDAIQNTLETMDGILKEQEHTLKEDGLHRDGCSMAYNIIQMFQIRLIEQKDNVDVVIKDFLKAFRDTPAEIRAMFTEVLFINLMIMWGVSQRRTSACSPKKISHPKDTMGLGSVLSYLDDTTKATVCSSLVRNFSESFKELMTPASDEKIGFIDESFNLVEADAKAFVASKVPVKDGPQQWDTIARIVNGKEAASIEDAVMQETYPEYITRHNEHEQ